MAEILGYDCNGKELRAGDRVQVVRCRNQEYQDIIGQIVTILGPSAVNHGQLEIDVRARIPIGTDFVSGSPEFFRKVGGDLGDWSEIGRVTGWRPRESENA